MTFYYSIFYFSDIAGLAVVTGACDEGWYCPSGSRLARQVACPRGFFCPAGSGAPESCAAGTYGSDANLVAQGDCTPCDPGNYCSLLNATGVTGPCDPGNLYIHCNGRTQ